MFDSAQQNVIKVLVVCFVVLSVFPAELVRGGESEAAVKPERVILLYMDGIHPRAIEEFDMQAIKRLRARGTYAETGIMVYPAHPTILPYGDWHYTSLPNVSTMSGSIFLSQRPRYLNQQFRTLGKTLHAAGSRSYRSLNMEYDYAFTTGGATDEELVDFYIEAFNREGDIAFARIMLQEVGNAGRVQSGKNQSDDPWAQNIFHPESPYAAAIRNADKQIARLVDFLKDVDAFESTIFVVMGDGQSTHGWHLTFDAEAALTPIIFSGPGIRAGRRIPYAENIDVAPTLAALFSLQPPNQDGGVGRVLTNLLVGGEPLEHPQYLMTINQQIRDHARLHAEATLRAFNDPKMNLLLMELDHHLLSEHQFFTVDRLMEWSEAGSLEGMVKANAWVLETLTLALRDNVYRFGDF